MLISINLIFIIVSVMFGFLLGFIGKLYTGVIKEKKIKRKLIKNLTEEIAANQAICKTIIKHGIIDGFLETYAWDRIRYNDTLRNSILIKDGNIYKDFYSVYMMINNINMLMGHYFSEKKYEKLNYIKDEAGYALQGHIKDFLPQLELLENEIKSLDNCLL